MLGRSRLGRVGLGRLLTSRCSRLGRVGLGRLLTSRCSRLGRVALGRMQCGVTAPHRAGPGCTLPRRVLAWLAGAAVLAAAAGLGGCTSARNTLATPVSACYRALPVAANAVHHRGKFAGVRLVDARSLASRPGLARIVAEQGGGPVRAVCVVVFHGSFDAAAVDVGAAGPSTGTRPYAVVMVAIPDDRFLGTVLAERPPWGGEADLL